MYRLIKSVLDWLTALLLTVILLPATAAICLIILADGNGKPIFWQYRSGLHGRQFKCYKFRTMTTLDVKFDIDNPVVDGDDAHVTGVGRFLRKFKLDELPQLFNILRGEMSFIGPRPLLTVYMERYEDWETYKLTVKPGLTGLGQVNGNGYLGLAERSYYEVKYALDMSFILDVEIFFKTFGVVFAGEEKFLRHVEPERIEQIIKKVGECRRTSR